MSGAGIMLVAMLASAYTHFSTLSATKIHLNMTLFLGYWVFPFGFTRDTSKSLLGKGPVFV